MPGRPQQRSLTSFFSPKTAGNPASKSVPAAAAEPEPETTMPKNTQNNDAGSKTGSKRPAARDDGGAAAAAVAAGKEGSPKRQRLDDSPTSPGAMSSLRHALLASCPLVYNYGCSCGGGAAALLLAVRITTISS